LFPLENKSHEPRVVLQSQERRAGQAGGVLE
jgi:hypothetical protein